MKELLEYIAKSIVDNKESVLIEESETPEGEVLLKLTVDPTDMGKIIGKEGKIINAVRTIIRILAIKQGKKVRVELTEVPGSEKPAQSEAAPVSGEIDLTTQTPQE